MFQELITYTEQKALEKNKKYNVCIEITIKSADILTKKIPQIYKTVSCFDFLYKTYNFFEKVEEKELISGSYSYFIDKTKFINYKDDIILITISNGEKESFKNIESSIKQIREEKSNPINPINQINQINQINPILCLDDFNKKYNIYMIYFPKYNDEEIAKLNEQIEEQKLKMAEQEEEMQKQKKEMQIREKEMQEKMQIQEQNIKKLEEMVNNLSNQLNQQKNSNVIA